MEQTIKINVSSSNTPDSDIVTLLIYRQEFGLILIIIYNRYRNDDSRLLSLVATRGFVYPPSMVEGRSPALNFSIDPCLHG